jgi:DNA-binding NarL/FixJ family response regulator
MIGTEKLGPASRQHRGNAPAEQPLEQQQVLPRKYVLLADQHPLFRYGLETFFNQQPDLICRSVVRASELLNTGVGEQRVDLVVMGLRFPDADGLDLVKTLHARQPHLLILIFSALDEAVYAERALRAGASGFLGKHNSPAELLSAVRCVLGGEIYLSRKMSILLLKRTFGSPYGNGDSGVTNLSDRELCVFQLLGAGLPSRGVATRLGISFKTVESHRENIKRKLGLSNGVELVHRAVQFVTMSGGPANR